VSFQSQLRFSDVNVTISGPDSVDFVGIRFTHGRMSYIVQENTFREKNSDEDTPDPDLEISATNTREFDKDNISEYVSSVRDKCEAEIEQVI
jgi:hypothetical protein